VRKERRKGKSKKRKIGVREEKGRREE